jgi:hypothetical protein
MSRKNKLLGYIGIGLFFIIMGVFIYVDYLKDIRGASERIELQSKLADELKLNSSCEFKVDSLVVVNDRLSVFETLTLAMIHREDAKRLLTYKVGDIVHLKSDSSRVVISDVLIGGGTYNYYVKYKVLCNDDTTKELVPELVY